jgi:hypothetical protein
MSDSHWIRNLAEAKLVKGVWLLKDPDESRCHAQGELADIVPTLLQDVEDACQVFNLYRQHHREMKLLPLKNQQNGTPYGLVLLLGPAQVKLEHVGGRLRQTLTRVNQYKKEDRITEEYRPHFDSFGGLFWKTSAESIITREQMVKTMLSEVCRLYYLAAGRNQTGPKT